MTHRITEDCVRCGGCVGECHLEAIVEGEGDEISRVNPEKCNDCGICMTTFCCPAAAIIRGNRYKKRSFFEEEGMD